MACYAGITTDPDRRRKEHERVRPSLRQWEVLGSYNSKSAAQAAENRLRERHGCDGNPGGAGAENDNWRLYHFYYG